LNFKICPFNALHHYHIGQEDQHLSNCSDRIALINNDFLIGEGPSGDLSIPPPINLKMETNEEDWN